MNIGNYSTTYVFLSGCKLAVDRPLTALVTECLSLFAGFSSPEELVETEVEKCFEEGASGRPD